MACKECYSDHCRVTPLLNSRQCLEKHIQYICSTCGRCICIDRDEKRDVYRWSFPFKTLEFAKLYLRTAEVSCEDICGIYEITGKNNRVSYKIFHKKDDLEKYLVKNKDKVCKDKEPIYISNEYQASPKAQIRRLDSVQIDCYIEEQRRC